VTQLPLPFSTDLGTGYGRASDTESIEENYLEF